MAANKDPQQSTLDPQEVAKMHPVAQILAVVLVGMGGPIGCFIVIAVLGMVVLGIISIVFGHHP